MVPLSCLRRDFCGRVCFPAGAVQTAKTELLSGTAEYLPLSLPVVFHSPWANCYPLILPLSHTYTHIGTAEHHTLLAGYLLQMRRGGLRWWLPQPPLAISRHLSLLSRYFPLPLTVNWWAAVKDALFLLRWPGKRCSTATNKRPYAGLITSSGAAFNSLTSALWLNKGSAIATDLIGGWRYICFFLSFFITA